MKIILLEDANNVQVLAIRANKVKKIVHLVNQDFFCIKINALQVVHHHIMPISTLDYAHSVIHLA